MRGTLRIVNGRRHPGEPFLRQGLDRISTGIQINDPADIHGVTGIGQHVGLARFAEHD